MGKCWKVGMVVGKAEIEAETGGLSHRSAASAPGCSEVVFNGLADGKGDCRVGWLDFVLGEAERAALYHTVGEVMCDCGCLGA